MQISRTGIYTLAVLALILVLNGTDPALGSEQGTADETGESYLPSEDAMADVSTAMTAARKSNRLLLVVMGANWCHDSRALASRLNQEPLRTLVKEHYETVYVDVGYLDKGRDVISSIGPPVYYATPSVLIVDPVSGRLINGDNRHQWGDAFTISMEDSVAYFELMASAEPTSSNGSGAKNADLKRLLAEIDLFEQQQSERVYAAYAVIGPMLKAYKEGEAPELFEAYWNEVRAFRTQVPADADSLRAQARERVEQGEQAIVLTYPDYPAFSWETKN